jgi:hypothetical protein
MSGGPDLPKCDISLLQPASARERERERGEVADYARVSNLRCEICSSSSNSCKYKINPRVLFLFFILQQNALLVYGRICPYLYYRPPLIYGRIMTSSSFSIFDFSAKKSPPPFW